ncbi:AAA family ATPase [Aeromonas enteropelogenes]|uniref:AAA family ATPase n=1 Tax=Aeromonas enteropelogenes TaxID=29489 RepID=UPI003135913A
MAFRVNSFSVEKDDFSTSNVILSKDNITDDSNYFTVLIGNNGTGKSRLLVNIVDAFKEMWVSNRRINFEYLLEYTLSDKTFSIERRKNQKILERIKNTSHKNGGDIITPNKVIAITTSLSDKFPNDKPPLNNDNYYSYLGVRNRMGAASSRSLMDKALLLMLANINTDNNNAEFREIFSYLEYEPIIKITYQVSRSYELYAKTTKINGDSLKNWLTNHIEKRGGLKRDLFRRKLEINSDNYWDDMARVYMDILNSAMEFDTKNEFTLLLNFSEENSNREMSKLGQNENRLYKILEELRRFDMVRPPSIKLYKKNGGEFDFYDASSGEVSILTTLIALISELKDNSLVVIDEPEISLHPSWQYRYVNLLDKILSNRHGCHIIIATHSHFIISDLPYGRSHIVHLKKGKKHTIDVEYIEQETQGQAAEDILLNVFGMPSTRNYYLSQQVTEALEIVASGKKNSPRYKELINKFEVYLPNLKKIDPLYEVLKKLVELGVNDGR